MPITRSQMTKQISKGTKKKKKVKIPKKYLAGLSGKELAKRKKEINKNARKSSKDPSAYKFATDFTAGGKRRKTKESKHTKKFRRMYG
jgi:23S rRNA maturation mini-RNase III|tara:strand:+ start:175 stop:438 length:264 start_codon:yes stop_codon:yes gene_type:complete